MQPVLISQFYKQLSQPLEFQAFLKKRLESIEELGGEVLAAIQPDAGEYSDAPDEIQVVRFDTPEKLQSFLKNQKNPDIAAMQEIAVKKLVEYYAKPNVPIESTFATVISARPPEFKRDLEPTQLFEKQLTQALDKIQKIPSHPAQHKEILDTRLFRPQNSIQKRLLKLVRTWEESLDRRVIFVHTYYLMTSNMLMSLDAGKFHDKKWVKELLARFAEYYFEALEKYEIAPFSAPPVWRVAFEVAQNKNSYTAQQLLLGVNAHINHDLVLSLIDMLKNEWASLSPTQKQKRYEDHTLVNEVIQTTFDETQALVIARYSPMLDMLNQYSFELDNLVISRLIKSWREQAWKHAVEYLNAEDWNQKHRAVQKAEYLTLRRADLIMLKQGPMQMKTLL